MTNEDTTDFDEHFAKISSYIVDTLHGVPLEMTEDEKEQFRIQVISNQYAERLLSEAEKTETYRGLSKIDILHTVSIPQLARTIPLNLITGRYMDNDLFFLVQYRNGKATEIGIQRDLSKVASIKLFGMDMFNTTAECIIDSLMKKDNVICNEKDLQLGTEYIFPEIGVRLWRERAFHPKLLKDPLYMEEMQAVLEDEYQYQYFQMITIIG